MLDETLLDLIYDATLDPALWVPVMERLCDAAGGDTACMTELDLVDGHGRGATARIDPSVMDEYFRDWADANPLLRVDDVDRYVAGWQPRILRDHDWMDRRSLERTGFFNDFLRKAEAEHSLIVRLGLANASVTTIQVGRRARRGAFEDDEIAQVGRYQPHLVRAQATARRLRLAEHAADQRDALIARSAQALLVVDRQGRLVRQSAAADTLLRDGRVATLHGRRLRLASREADRWLARVVAGDASAGASVAVIARDGKECFQVELVRSGARLRDVLGGDTMIGIVPMPAPPSSAETHLRDLFGLTAAETRVALGVARGRSLREVAEAGGVSIHTVRAQLGAVFGKTNCRRQAEVVALFAARGIAPLQSSR